MIREGNRENQSDYFNGSRFNSDNINNAISKEKNNEKIELSNKIILLHILKKEKLFLFLE